MVAVGTAVTPWYERHSRRLASPFHVSNVLYGEASSPRQRGCRRSPSLHSCRLQELQIDEPIRSWQRLLERPRFAEELDHLRKSGKADFAMLGHGAYIRLIVELENLADDIAGG